MKIYRAFAQYYQEGYVSYASRMGAYFPGICDRIGLRPGGNLLDIACGIGDFALKAAEHGWIVYGIDQSPAMLGFAQRTAAGTDGLFYIRGDMRHLPFREKFDVCTCWYDSLNYMTTVQDLCTTFGSASKALKRGGWFLFDMNTIKGLMVNWQQEKCYVKRDEDGVFEVHQSSCDYDQQIASLKITGFRKIGNRWERMDEVHREKGYSLKDIQTYLSKSGFVDIHLFGNLDDFDPPDENNSRVWVIAQKG